MLNKRYKKVTFIFWFLINYLFISMQTFANDEKINSDFIFFVERVEHLQNTNIAGALALLDSYQTNINVLTVENQVKYFQVMAEIYIETSQYRLAHNAASQGLKIAQHLTSPTLLISELSYLRGFSLESLGDANGAVENYLNGLEVAESLDAEKFIADGFINLGAVYYLTEQFEKSLTMLNNALVIANTLDNEELKGSVNSELGILYSYMFNSQKSVKFYQASYEHYKKAGMELYALNSLQNIAINHMEENRYEQAIPLFEEVIESASKLSNNELIGGVYTRLSMSHAMKKTPDLDVAYQYITLAEKYLKGVQQHNALLYFNVNKAYVLEAMERYDEALESLDISEKLLARNSQTKNTFSHYNLMYLQSEIYYKKEKYKQAYEKQSQYLTRLFNDQLNVNMEKVEELRLRYESKQADLKNKILEQERSVQIIQLSDVTYHEKNLQFLIFFVALIVLSLAWFLFKMVQSQKHLVRISQVDDLTGVANRRRLMELGEQMLIHAKKEQSFFSLLMLDVDNFKAINDDFGHNTGDKILKNIAELANSIMRKNDSFCRFGGEEFIILLPDTSSQSAYEIAERLRLSIYNQVWSCKDLAGVTVSIGISSNQRENDKSFAQLIKDADINMYQAKKLGKNRVYF
ncbi:MULTISPECIES: GGDEF domain-containing protein [unclassified Colwellia]|uniref:GGDEF domain-containing protein n=1 Tax=unclassified Colwellia TaxID=196834 RepID=UPI0015F483B8|nr:MULTISPECIES: GGDEF domain-containing protein [unclassified Colwellia]MBA6233241.1 diguanylate cyclase [Colwellia sp. MB02u-7]MBA6236331.1 diguanylate cyclase [Colwellia sp. MB02u-11]MBA6298269.1 diguanylate cyclase [Colwellia sp. MB3u-22]MBA6311906.1 diguanylate cyclase [Colwellia sp. MB3u-64]